MSDKYFVVCYDRLEYNTFVKKKIRELHNAGSTSISYSDFVYVKGPDTLRGYGNPRGWLYGRWRERENIEHILMTLVTCHDGNNVTLLKMLKEVRDAL
jgi:hypothetical protein